MTDYTRITLAEPTASDPSWYYLFEGPDTVSFLKVEKLTGLTKTGKKWSRLRNSERVTFSFKKRGKQPCSLNIFSVKPGSSIKNLNSAPSTIFYGAIPSIYHEKVMAAVLDSYEKHIGLSDQERNRLDHQLKSSPTLVVVELLYPLLREMPAVINKSGWNFTFPGVRLNTLEELAVSTFGKSPTREEMSLLANSSAVTIGLLKALKKLISREKLVALATSKEFNIPLLGQADLSTDKRVFAYRKILKHFTSDQLIEWLRSKPNYIVMSAFSNIVHNRLDHLGKLEEIIKTLKETRSHVPQSSFVGDSLMLFSGEIEKSIKVQTLAQMKEVIPMAFNILNLTDYRIYNASGFIEVAVPGYRNHALLSDMDVNSNLKVNKDSPLFKMVPKKYLTEATTAEGFVELIKAVYRAIIRTFRKIGIKNPSFEMVNEYFIQACLAGEYKLKEQGYPWKSHIPPIWTKSKNKRLLAAEYLSQSGKKELDPFFFSLLLETSDTVSEIIAMESSPVTWVQEFLVPQAGYEEKELDLF